MSSLVSSNDGLAFSGWPGRVFGSGSVFSHMLFSFFAPRQDLVASIDTQRPYFTG
jgi:hypothetical protein